jgi:hypothetical protein
MNITYSNLRHIFNKHNPYSLYYDGYYAIDDVYDPEVKEIILYFNTIDYIPSYEQLYDKVYNIVIINRYHCDNITKDILNLL